MWLTALLYAASLSQLSAYRSSNASDSTTCFGKTFDQYAKVYPSASVSSRSSAFLLAVGTNGRLGDYQAVAEAIVEAVPTLYVVVVDTNPGNFVKISPEDYITSASCIKDHMSSRNFSIQHWYVGGHSASGYAAIKAIDSLKLPFVPTGYIGFDPVGSSSTADAILHIPSLIFTTAYSFCTFTNARGGDFYKAADIQENKCTKYYLVDVTDAGHCSFSGGMCRFGIRLPVCAGTVNQNTFNDILAVEIANYMSKKVPINESDVVVSSMSSAGCGNTLYVV